MNSGGVDQANTYLEAIVKRFAWLADNPLLGKPRDDIKKGYYCFPVGMHLVFYKIRNDQIEENQIEIIGVPHQSMDIFEYVTSE